ncbi:protein prenyltransferase subunit alpha [Encephalitozoon intestinalis ATCC 50506]|uniref:Protein prenyltransferase subunit alpha n=1 Tax=Encephalitozoon intestinalis (strain ATCC 50506) TaxID=876142 RepID=E0S5W4_ENCIT|nr:protein prenyltransferase subunit alpha [Encephalitozoon intestinalis ATCC 50506]ADM11099.1 protein prenyltransferase subunit alpha [Encephalitozoon intestinalis ATCC 50506]UTX44753.1 protein farnesyltransferase/geranylgeranyltransferase [Encephalitozoon intestinalis]
MIIHNIEEGEYIEDKEALEGLLNLRLQEESIEKHKAIVQVVADDYYSWNKLKDYLLLNPSDFRSQLKVCENALQGNPKSYQPWYHRKFMMENFKEQREKYLGREDFLTKLLLDSDPRNFHCWSYRMFFLKTKTGRDVFNYSYLHHHPDSEDPLTIIYTDPMDPTSWEYFYLWRERKRIRHGMYIRRFRNRLEILLDKPFCGELSFESGGTRKTMAFELHTRIVVIDESIRTSERWKVVINGEEMRFIPEEESFRFVREILEEEPECYEALLVLLDYTEEEAERIAIIERIASLDPIRRGYYDTLKENFYCVYVPEIEGTPIE